MNEQPMTFRFPSGHEVTIYPASRTKAEHEKVLRVQKNSRTRMGWTYAKAVAKWIAAGSPTRSEAEIARIFAICEACPYFARKSKRPHCTICGCSLNTAPNGLVNKIAMDVTEHCPLDPPKW